MNELNLRFEMEKGADAEKAKAEIDAALAKLRGVEESGAFVESPRLTGVEVMMAVSAVAVLAATVRKALAESHGAVKEGRGLINEARGAVQDARKLVDDLGDLVASLRRLGGVKGVKEAYLEVGEKKVPLAQVTEADLRDAITF